MRKFLGDTLVLATHNAGKVAEIRDLLGARVPQILYAGELGLPEPAETGTTFLENATIKAVAAARASNHIALADDSGLEVAVLGGAPGVYTADWAGHPRNFRAAMHRVWAEMNGDTDARARFVCVMVLAWPDGHTEHAVGDITGQVVCPPRGTGGHGYDPMFMPDGASKTWGEMPAAAKMARSHRSAALANLLKAYF